MAKKKPESLDKVPEPVKEVQHELDAIETFDSYFSRIERKVLNYFDRLDRRVDKYFGYLFACVGAMFIFIIGYLFAR